MAYSHPTLQRIGPANSDAPTFWSYSTTDTGAVVQVSGYFNDAAADLTVGDLIYAAVDTGGTPAFMFYPVVSNDGTIVDVSDGLAVTATDTN